MTDIKELRPCPFCGGEAKAFQFDNDDAFVVCQQCNGRMQIPYPSKKDAIKAWNTRAQNALLDEAMEALKPLAYPQWGDWLCDGDAIKGYIEIIKEILAKLEGALK